MSKIVYNIRQALVQIKRNKGMSFASVFAITAMMLILGLFFVITVNINLFTEMVKEDYDQVEIFMLDETAMEETEELMSEVNRMDGVSDAVYRSKEDALNIMKKRWGESGYLLDSLGENPLPDSILVTVDSMEAASDVTEFCQDVPVVEDVKYYKETVEKLTKVTDFMQIAAIVIMTFLVIVSVVVVSNTIKLTVFARSKEISIMKYIGATNWFIRGPFLVEGIIIGIFSSLVSAGITYLIYSQVEEHVGLQIMTILSMPLVPAGYLASNLICIFLAMGISIGAGGSIISMRRFLDTKKVRPEKAAKKTERKSAKRLAEKKAAEAQIPEEIQHAEEPEQESVHGDAEIKNEIQENTVSEEKSEPEVKFISRIKRHAYTTEISPDDIKKAEKKAEKEITDEDDSQDVYEKNQEPFYEEIMVGDDDFKFETIESDEKKQH